MGKLLRLCDYILISAAIAGELMEEIRLVGGFLPSAMINQYGYVPSKYKRRSYLNKVSEMLTVGDIEKKVDKQGKQYLILTSIGKIKYKRKFRLLYNEEKWDGYFMVVVFDIAEKRRKTRDAVRSKLQELGFGMLQESVWISPYHFEEDLREFLEIYNLGDEVFVLSAKKVLAGNTQKLTVQIWSLRKINKGYKKVIAKINKALKENSDKKVKLIDEAFSIYTETLLKDPILPKTLLPDYWSREKALKLLNKQQKIIHEFIDDRR